MKKTLSKEALQEYRSMLPHGAIKRIYQNSGYKSVTSVYNFLNGITYNAKIAKEVRREVINYKNLRKRLLKREGIN